MQSGPEKRVCDLFGIVVLDAFRSFEPARRYLRHGRDFIDYLRSRQKGKTALLRPPQKEAEARSVQIDAAHKAQP